MILKYFTTIYYGFTQMYFIVTCECNNRKDTIYLLKNKLQKYSLFVVVVQIINYLQLKQMY